MQSLYGYAIIKTSLFFVNRDLLAKKYTVDPFKDDFANSKPLSKKRKYALKLYDERLKSTQNKEEDCDDEIKDSVSFFFEKYQKEVVAEGERIKDEMMKSTQNLQSEYYKMLMLPVEIRKMEKQFIEKRKAAFIQKEEQKHYPLQQNKIVEMLSNSKELKEQISKNEISWAPQYAVLKTWYVKIIEKENFFEEYAATANPTFDQDQKIILKILKCLLMQNDLSYSFFLENDIKWTENSHILLNMVNKTLKNINSIPEENMELRSIIQDENDDFNFFLTIFETTLNQEVYLEELIANNVQNWDIDRIALVDRVILKMAITEMIYCKSIPIKVTLNEYIEIGKKYSTPKSQQFLNGILDVLFTHLTSKGVIKKTGRGLIDNQ